VKVQSEEEVKSNWEKLKLKEGKKSVLEGVPKSLPAMVKAIRIQEKARGVGFDWDNKDQVWEKVLEELNELKEEMDKGDEVSIEAEFGDLIFSLINYARFIDVNPEDALEKTNKKFIKRFQYMEEQLQKEGRSMDQLLLKELDLYWNKAKTI
jgi:XTP/dITP diphosphohydrolase